MADVFDEVEEQLRSARYKDMAIKSWPYVLAALAAAGLVALGVYGWGAYTRAKDAAASQDYAQALTALSNKDTNGADALFGKVAKEGRGGYRALALMQQAGLRLRDAKPDAAIALLDDAAKADRDPVLSDAAALQAGWIAMDRAPLAQIQSRLEPLIAVGRPYRATAREALAMAKLAAGRTAEARSDLQILVLQQDVADNTRQRAQAAIAMIDSGAAAAIPQVVKAQAAAPPQPLVVPAPGPAPGSSPGPGPGGAPGAQ